MRILKDIWIGFVILYHILMIIGALEFDLVKFEGYSFKPQGNRTKICEGPQLTCIRSCMANTNCRAMSFEGNTTRCEAVKYVLYARVLLVPKVNPTVWTKSILNFFKFKKAFAKYNLIHKHFCKINSL